MSNLIAFFVLVVTIIPALLIGIILSPFGLSDDFAHGYESWLTDTVCNCRQEVNEVEK